MQEPKESNLDPRGVILAIVIGAIAALGYRWFAHNKHHWHVGTIQSANSSTKELIVKLPDTAAVITVFEKMFNSLQQDKEICVEYSRNRMTKEIQVFSYADKAECLHDK
jgi:hypothetical protein